MIMTTKSTKPWENSPPAKSKHTKLTPKSEAKARAAAKRAGRKYPNLVDNMKAAQEQRGKTKKQVP